MNNPKVYVNNNFLKYSDSKYQFNLELYSSFILETELIEHHNYVIILKKTDDLSMWDSLLKERCKYKYFITVNWDKYNTYLKLKEKNTPLDEDSMYNEKEFQELMENGVLDQISSDED